MLKEIASLGIVGIVGYVAYTTFNAQSDDESYGSGGGYIEKVVEKANNMPALEKKSLDTPKIIIQEASIPLETKTIESKKRYTSRGGSGKKYNYVSKGSETFIVDKETQQVLGVESEKYQMSMTYEEYKKREQAEQEVIDYLTKSGEEALIDMFEESLNNSPKKYNQKPKEDKGIIDSVIDLVSGWL